MSKYKVRFNLGKGEHFMKWKVTSPEGHVDYYDPNEHTLIMHMCKLRNQPSAANKIFEGANKTVCAWIDAEHVEVKSEAVPIVYHSDIELLFNPRKQPHWTYYTDIQNLDNKEIDCIVTEGRRVWDVAPSQSNCNE